MTDRETIIAWLASRGKTVDIKVGGEPDRTLLIGRGGGTFDLLLGADGKALQGVA